MNVISMRLLSQQLAAPLFDDPAQAVGWFGFMQAQDHRMMRWAVAMRTRRPSAQAFRNAYDAGTLIRIHLFRCTWQIAAARDVRWMLRLCAEKCRRGLFGFLRSSGQAFPQKEYERFALALPSVLKGRPSTTKDDLLRRLADSGCSVQAPRMCLRLAEYDGIVCSGHLHPTQATYALFSERVPDAEARESAGLSREESLIMLARLYFRSHSPATAEDFIWWAGLGAAECRDAVRALAGELEPCAFGGAVHYIHEDSRTRGCRNAAVLLPSYDEYLIGYKSRGVVLAEEHKHRAHNGFGVFRPVVLSGGRVVGNWDPRRLSADFFLPEYETDLEAARLRYSDFLKS